MAKAVGFQFKNSTRKKRKGTHSKNASVGQSKFKKKKRGQG